MSNLACDGCGYTQEDFMELSPEHADSNEWFTFKDKKMCGGCYQGLVVHDLKSLALIPSDDYKQYFAELDASINKWAYHRNYTCNICDFCYFIDKTVKTVIEMYTDDNALVRICLDCLNSYDKKVDDLFESGASEVEFANEAPLTKEMLMEMKDSFTPMIYIGDCNPVERHHLVPSCINLKTTKDMFDLSEEHDDLFDEDIIVKLKEWVLITDGFDDGWYHGHGDKVLAFNCSKDRFGTLATIGIHDTGFRYEEIGHYYDYVKCMIEHQLCKDTKKDLD